MHTAPSKSRNVSIDAAFLARVYHGTDPDGFAQFVGRAAADDAFLVYAEQPDTLAVLELGQATHGLGKVAYGHCLSGDFALLRLGLDAAARLGCQHFIYPIACDQANRVQLERILCRRFGFAPYQLHLIKELTHHGS